MPSTIFVLALSLGLCLLFSFFSIIILLGFLYRQYSHNRREARLAREEIYELQKELNSFPKGWKPHEFTSGFTQNEVKEAFMNFVGKTNQYVEEWVFGQMPSHPFNDSLSRIEDIIFPAPDDPNTISPLNADKDIRVFHNPHNYTATEIKAYLEKDCDSKTVDPTTRLDIVEHIMMSILLTSVSLDGDRTKSLLPFTVSEICGLDRLFATTRHVQLFDVENFLGLISIYFSRPRTQVPRRQIYHRLFNSLFEPYYNPQPDIQSEATRYKHLDKVLDAAVNYGMKVLGHGAIVETRWGSRPDGRIMRRPALYFSHFSGQRLDYCEKVVEDSIEEAERNANLTEEDVRRFEISLGLRSWSGAEIRR